MPTHNTNDTPSWIRSNFWVVILLVLGIIVFIFTALFEKDEEETQYDKGISPPEQDGVTDTYQRLEGLGLNESTKLLQGLSQRARQIVPHFPEFPTVWLLPPRARGSYDSIPERYSIEFMELLFPGERFQKVRPAWLRNTLHKTGRNLELDGYCSNLSLAIEYNGKQHYEWPNFTGMTKEEFQRQRERDQLKAQICMEKEICLIRIPYTVPLERLPLAIYSKLLDAVPGL